MPVSQIQPERIQPLNSRPVRPGGYVLYWMQQCQRAEWNHALEYAVERANALLRPLAVGFCLTDRFPDANLRHYRFMLEGLQETARALRSRGIPFLLSVGDPADVALRLAKDACVVICDRGYLRIQREWRRKLAAQAEMQVIQVESDVVVPADQVSRKAEYAARTIRPKIARVLKKYMIPLQCAQLKKFSSGVEGDSEVIGDIDSLLSSLNVDRSVTPVPGCCGGRSHALTALEAFVAKRLKGYDRNRGRPETDNVSHMARYLHFGQISPLEIALAARKAHAPKEDIEAFLEELIVRRELAINYVLRNPAYDRYAGLPAWARATLARHRKDPRNPRYSAARLENAETHDPYWNAAMREMRYTGYMHNYMRMYWGKKILEWSANPEAAYRTALKLNNKYFLDGRDPSAYANIGWLFGLHDRPWGEREIFGMVRYMSAGGLERKADPDAYVAKVERSIAALDAGDAPRRRAHGAGPAH